jgi:hypothetical protein
MLIGDVVAIYDALGSDGQDKTGDIPAAEVDNTPPVTPAALNSVAPRSGETGTAAQPHQGSCAGRTPSDQDAGRIGPSR